MNRSTLALHRAKARTLTTTSVAAILVGTLAGPQMAAAQTAPQSAQAPAVAEEIVVTGSRIVRDGYEAPTPVSVLSSEELDAMNTTTIADAVNALPAFTGSVTPRTMTGNLSSGAAGVNQLNLRGMGTNRTLILLDGQRVINSSLTSANSAPDINSFPSALVQRVDVVTGGASAAYGSDALSGVVNFVINKEFTGIKGELQGGITDYGDDKSYTAALTIGQPFANGRGHFLLSGELSYSGGVKGGDFMNGGRPWAEVSANVVVNPDYIAGVAGAPQYIVGRQTALSRGTPGGVITEGPLKGIMFGPGGTPAPFTFGVNVGNNLMIGGDWEVSRIDGPDLAPRLRRNVAYMRASYDLTDNITGFIDAQWAHAHADNDANPNRRLGNNTVRVDNAFLPETVRDQMLALGLTSFRMGSSNGDMKRFRADNRRTMRRGSFGFNGNATAFETDWSWNAYFQHSMTGLSPRTPFNGHTANYLRAMDAVVSNGNIVCRVNVDANPSNDDPNCVPYNVMGIGVNNQKALDYVTGTSYRYESLKQNVAAFSANGEPFDLWAGPVSLAFGVEHRTESVKGVATAADEATSYFAGNYKASQGKFNVTEGFAEVLIPLAVNEEWAKELDLNAAVRATSYSTSGYVTTWKAGLTWTPVDDIRFRFTRSRDIRAPNLGELFTAGQTGSGTPLFDPFLNLSIPASFTLTRGNPNLKPEKADTTGIGAVFTPTFLPGFAASVDYYRINVKGTVQAPNSQTVVDLCFEGNQVLCQAIERDPTTGLIFLVVTQPQNLTGQRASGLDLEASYRFPLADINENWDGNISIRAIGTRVLQLDTEDVDGNVFDGVGVIGSWGGIPPHSANLDAPKFRGSLSVAYDGGPLTLRWTGRYWASGVYGNGFVECSTGCPASTTLNPTFRGNHIPSHFTMDLAGSYRPFEDRDIELFMTVENITNKQPPIIGGSRSSGYWYGMGNNEYDRIGRQYRGGVRFQY